MIRTIKTVVFWLVAGISALLLFQVVRAAPAKEQVPEISYSRFMADVEAGQVARVSILGNRIEGQYRDSKGSFRLVGPSNPAIYLDRLRDKSVEVWFKDAASGSVPLQLLGTWAPLILLGALWFFMVRQMRRRGGSTRGGDTPGSAGKLA